MKEKNEALLKQTPRLFTYFLLKQPDPKFSGTDPVVPSATDAEITPISDTETEQLTEDQKQDVDALNNSSNTSEIITENKKK